MNELEYVEGIVIIPRPTQRELNERQEVAYRAYRERFIKWLVRQGKDPDSFEGYAYDTAKQYASVHDMFSRWVWDRRGFTTDLTHEDAEEYLQGQMLADEDYSSSYLHSIKLTLKAYFRFRGDEWDTNLTVRSSRGVSQPKDFVTVDERRKIREAALEYGTLPAYAALTPEKREEWKLHLARRFGKPVRDVSPEDWKRANGFKYPSIVCASLDAGLRPVEVGRARTHWVDIENSLLRIPESESSKNEDNWTVGLRQDTTEYLARWLQERKLYGKYEDSDRLWLTRHNNPYSTGSLRVLLDNLREIAGIDRDLTWYAIRHSVGTYMAREEGLAAAQSQLRHKRASTTMKYDQAPVEDRQDALERMG